MGTLKEEIAKNLLFYRKQKKLTQKELAEKIGVKHNAISSWESGTNSIDVEVLFKICNALEVSINDMYGSYAKDESLVPSERDIIRKYRALDEHGKDMVDIVIEKESDRMAADAMQSDVESSVTAFKIIPLLGSSFAAGKGEPDFGNMWEDYEVPADSPAEFAIKINGDSMEPYLADGSVAYGKKRTPKDGEVAALLLDGEFLVKQVCQDHLGNLYLFALNRDRNDTDVTIWHDSGRNVLCFGTIIMSKDVPLPLK